jgi:FAD/FMN-containing dehydrogenase
VKRSSSKSRSRATLSGEHGIGTQKREFLPLELDG